MRKTSSLALLSLALLAPGHAFAEKVLASVKVSTKAMSHTGFSTGDIVSPGTYQQANHNAALTSLHAEAALLVAATPGATRHELVVTKVKHDVMWSHATEGFEHGEDHGVNERFVTTKMGGKVTIYGN